MRMLVLSSSPKGEVKMNEWIDCTSRVPDGDFPCLVTCREYDFFRNKWRDRYVCILSYMPQFGIWNVKSNIRVEAWMPLPEPYDEKEVIK